MSSMLNPIRRQFTMVFLFALVGMAAGCSRAPLPGAPESPEHLVHFLTEPSRVTNSSDELEEVIVILRAGVDPIQFASEFGATLAEFDDWGCARFVPNPNESADLLAARMELDSRAITAEQDEMTETAESRQKSVSFDDGLGSPQAYFGQAQALPIGLAIAHQVSRGGNVKVAILDTGADLTHPVLSRRIVGGWDFIDNDADPSDVQNGIDDDGDGDLDEAYGHGTHVAGIVSLVAPDAQLLIVRVLDADGRGDMMNVAQGIIWAKQHGARVINLSLGSLNSSDMVQYALEYADEMGLVVSVASAGNWGAAAPVEYPARSSHALAVAALDNSDQRAAFSSYGSWVDFAAPGIAIRSAFPGGGYALWSGTSMSAPFLAGASALLLSVHPTWDMDMVENRLSSTARSLEARNPGLDDLLGEGALDIGAALAPDMRPTSTTGGKKETTNRGM